MRTFRMMALAVLIHTIIFLPYYYVTKQDNMFQLTLSIFLITGLVFYIAKCYEKPTYKIDDVLIQLESELELYRNCKNYLSIQNMFMIIGQRKHAAYHLDLIKLNNIIYCYISSERYIINELKKDSIYLTVQDLSPNKVIDEDIEYEIIISLDYFKNKKRIANLKNILK